MINKVVFVFSGRDTEFPTNFWQNTLIGIHIVSVYYFSQLVITFDLDQVKRRKQCLLC